MIAFWGGGFQKGFPLSGQQSGVCRQREWHQENFECLECQVFFFFWLKHWLHITGRYTRQDIMGREGGLNFGGSYDLGEE